MKKLLLASANFSRLGELTEKPLDKIRLAYIPTAGDPYKNKWFLEEDRKLLRKMGINFFEVDLKNKNKQELEGELKGVDVVFVSGGNAYYLLEKAQESGFNEVVKKLVNQGMIYVGVSAGAVLAGPTIESVDIADDRKAASYLKSLEGLNLVDFVILPHYGEKKEEKLNRKILKKYRNRGYKLIPLTNQQAIIVKDGEYRIVNSS